MRVSIEPPAHVPTRRQRLAASAIDAASELLAFGAGLVIATVWLLLRTDLGRLDAGGGEGMAAASFVGAALPAWGAWLALRVSRDGVTLGQRVAGLVVAPAASTWQRHLRLAIHPLAVPLWAWLAVTAMLTGLPWLWLVPVLAGALVALGGAASFTLLLASPERRALHDLIAGTALAPRS